MAGREGKGIRIATRDRAIATTRSAPASWDPDQRTLDIVLASTTPVLRRGWSESYYEILSMAAGAVRLERLNNGAPVLLQHDGWDSNALLGSFVKGSARIEGQELLATIRFVPQATAEARGVEPFIQEIAAGFRDKWSVGYDIHDYREIGKADDGVMRVEVTDWEPHEGSSVLIPADDSAHSRAAKSECTCGATSHENQGAGDAGGDTNDDMRGRTPHTQQEATMAGTGTQTTPTPTAPAAEPTPAPVDTAAIEARARQEAAAQAQRRHDEILTACRQLRLNPTDEAVAPIVGDHQRSVADVREALFDLAVKRDERAGISGVHGGGGGGVEVGTEEIDHVREGMASYLMHRKYGSPLEGRARDYVGMTWFDLGRECLELQGVRTKGIDRLTLAKRMLHVRDGSGAVTTGHFPALVAAVTGKSLARGYDAVMVQYPRFSARRTPPDLRTQRELFVDSVGDLAEVNETGDYTYTIMTEGEETWQLLRRGRMVKVTPELILNDELGAITTVPQKMGAASARTREKVFWTRVQAATVMADGVAVYDAASHGNVVAAGGAPSWPQIAAMQILLDAQTDRSGELIAIELDRFAFPPAHRASVATLWTRIVPEQQSNATPEEVYSLGKAVVPYLTGTAWYGFANPELYPAFVHGELEGRSGPTVEEEYDFDSSCLKIKVEDYFGIGAVDYRPTVRNPGA